MWTCKNWTLAKLKLLKDLAIAQFLRTCADPQELKNWTLSEYEVASAFPVQVTDDAQADDNLRQVVSQRLDNAKAFSSINLLTPVILYFFSDWVKMGTSWDTTMPSTEFSRHSLRLWASLENAVILGGPEGFESESSGPVPRYGNQQYYGVRPGDLRGVVDEATCFDIQAFLYTRERCLAAALPVWAAPTYERFDAASHELLAKRAQARLADPSYNPLDFCSFDDDACWEALKLQSV